MDTTKVVSTSCHQSANLDPHSGFEDDAHRFSPCVNTWHPTNPVDDPFLQCRVTHSPCAYLDCDSCLMTKHDVTN